MELKTTITCLGGNVISWSADTIDVENNGITITINEMLCGTKSRCTGILWVIAYMVY